MEYLLIDIIFYLPALWIGRTGMFPKFFQAVLQMHLLNGNWFC